MSYTFRAVGYSEAGRRIQAAGEAYQRERMEAPLREEAKRSAERAEKAAEALRKAKEEEAKRLVLIEEARVFAPRDPAKDASDTRLLADIVLGIKKDACILFKINLAELLSARRSHHLVMARYYAMQRLADETPLSLPRIGRTMGGRDHTTVLHGLRAEQRERVRLHIEDFQILNRIVE